jgi:hypothetical protein
MQSLLTTSACCFGTHKNNKLLPLFNISYHNVVIYYRIDELPSGLVLDSVVVVDVVLVLLLLDAGPEILLLAVITYRGCLSVDGGKRRSQIC